MTANPIAGAGTVDVVGGRHVLRFQRRFAHPVDAVWDALTTPARLTDWFGATEIELDLVAGGRFEARTTGPPSLVEAIIREAGEDALVQHNVVLRVEPPTLFEHTFGDPDSVVRWELERDGDGCRLTLTHTQPAGFPATDAPRDLAGWHSLLDHLGEALDGRPGEHDPERWERLRDRYEARLG